MAEKYRTIELNVLYTYAKPTSDSIPMLKRSDPYIHPHFLYIECLQGKLVIEKECEYIVLLYDAFDELLATSSLDFFYQENYLDGDKGPIYLNLTRSLHTPVANLREECNSKWATLPDKE